MYSDSQEDRPPPISSAGAGFVPCEDSRHPGVRPPRAESPRPADAQPFQTSHQHILARLEQVDLRLQVCIARMRGQCDVDDRFRGLVISETEIDQTLRAPFGMPRWARGGDDPHLQAAWQELRRHSQSIKAREQATERHHVELRLLVLARRFGLDDVDQEALLVCLAPELDLRYERLYAYLQDDVTKKRPSIDLFLSLTCASWSEKLTTLNRFGAYAPLLRHHLIQVFDDPSQVRPPLLAKYLRLDERIVRYLLDSDQPAECLHPHVERLVPAESFDTLLIPDTLKQRLTGVVREFQQTAKPAILYLYGLPGVGRRRTAEAIAHVLGRDAFFVDGTALTAHGSLAFDDIVTLTLRETVLSNSVLCWTGFDVLLSDDMRQRRKLLVQRIKDSGALACLIGTAQWESDAASDDIRDPTLHRIELPCPDYRARIELWRQALHQSPIGPEAPPVEVLADKFRLTSGQIHAAIQTAQRSVRLTGGSEKDLGLGQLYAACREQSSSSAAKLARRIVPRYSWDDIILPADRATQLREIYATIRNRAIVYHDWGFDDKLSLGKGIHILFSGPSGTGKTMAAEVIANALGLAVYKVDLSTVVSKYIGDTEKNLALTFREAEGANAILFFDEADALFGRRSEVKDSHDRYANIETAYLLQKMEEYDGVVILATNLRRNLDDAFARRLAFVVAFPAPEEPDRLRIWKKIWPAQTPLAPDVDLDFLAHQFKLAGGNIKNIALASAFLAAEDGEAVGMSHLVRATRRELQKLGKVCVEGDFGRYYQLIKDPKPRTHHDS